MERHPRISGREDLLAKLWDDQAYVDENTLNVNITRVRKSFRSSVLKMQWKQCGARAIA